MQLDDYTDELSEQDARKIADHVGEAMEYDEGIKTLMSINCSNAGIRWQDLEHVATGLLDRFASKGSFASAWVIENRPILGNPLTPPRETQLTLRLLSSVPAKDLTEWLGQADIAAAEDVIQITEYDMVSYAIAAFLRGVSPITAERLNEEYGWSIEPQDTGRVYGPRYGLSPQRV